MATNLPVLPDVAVGDVAHTGVSGALVTISGCLVAEPELRYTGAGVAWARLRVALRGTDSTIHQDVFAAGGVAEASARSLRTGDRVRVQGRLRGRRWIDADGQGCYDVDIIASAVEALSARAA